MNTNPDHLTSAECLAELARSDLKPRSAYRRKVWERYCVINGLPAPSPEIDPATLNRPAVPKIRRIVVILETSGRRGPVYYGFRYTDTNTGITVEAQTTCSGESNILRALTHDGQAWRSDYYRETINVTERHLFALPQAGCDPEEIRRWVADTSAALAQAALLAATNTPTA